MTPTTIADLRGTPPGARPRSRVLAHYGTIREARDRGWSWDKIGEAVGLSGDATRKAHERVQRAIAAGQIDPQALARASSPAQKAPPRPPEQAEHKPEHAEHKPGAGWQGWKTLSNQGDNQ